ncbi:MAG: hypothetical protein Q8L57_03920, partial [bacterium]|nr:hypothetical protein [bacterium]
IHLSFTIGDEIEGKDFLLALLEDEESQKIFRQFSEAGITIIVGNRYDIFDGFVKINVKDGVKKAAEWLEKGQVK